MTLAERRSSRPTTGHVDPEGATALNVNLSFLEEPQEFAASSDPAVVGRLLGRSLPAAAVASGELEEDCREYLEALRWPNGVECPRCEETHRLIRLENRAKWHCYSCRYQFSVTAGTLFHNSHLPLWKWFLAVHLLAEEREGVPANQLRAILGVSYKTAWFMGHRIRAAMRGDGERLLLGMTEDARPPASAEVWGKVAGVAAAAYADGERRLPAGPYHQLSPKHLSAYVGDFQWRSANEGNPHVFRDVIVALLRGDGMSYRELVGEAA
ncbi:MAG: hypothetical protein F2663_05530 [Actinobacteria bacterium]|nr:hypothetical protein [Actinomycetota bacterium]